MRIRRCTKPDEWCFHRSGCRAISGLDSRQRPLQIRTSYHLRCASRRAGWLLAALSGSWLRKPITTGKELISRSKFRRMCFTEYQCPLGSKCQDDRCIDFGMITLVDRRKMRGGHVFGVDDVFDSNGDPVERTPLFGRNRVERSGRSQDDIRVEVRPSLDHRIPLLYSSDQSFSTSVSTAFLNILTNPPR